MSDDGVIFSSIDDREQANLKNIKSLVFGENNFINNIIWEKKYSPQNDAKWFSDNHDFLICYSKDKETFRPNLLARTEEQNNRYKNLDDDIRGIWKTSDLSVKRETAKDIYEVITPSGRVVLPPKGRSWGVGKEKLQLLIDDNRIWFGKNGDAIPQLKRFITDVKNGVVPLSPTVDCRTR